MQPYPRRHRSKPKLPPSGPKAPPRIERVIPIVRKSIPSDETMEQIYALAPPWLQDKLRAEVPREYYAEARGQTQLLPQHKPRAQTTFLAKTQGSDDED